MTPQLHLFLRTHVPQAVRIGAALLRRAVRDRRNGVHRRLVGRISEADRKGTFDWSVVTQTAQPVRDGELSEGKRHNLALGLARLDGVIVQPGEILSFWALIGPPGRRSGFVPGRAIRAGVLQADLGGGLCQLSGLIYTLGLHAGLDVVERAPHSRDIYSEEERVVPLGLDATVVWPWKDLRLRNPHPYAIRLSLGLEGGRLFGAVHAAGPIAARCVHTRRVDLAYRRMVTVERCVDGAPRELVSRDEYRIGSGIDGALQAGRLPV